MIMIEFWKRRGTLQRRSLILWKPYTQGASFLEVEMLLRVRINCMPHTLEQFYKFFACMVKPLCAGFIIPIFYMYNKAFDHGLYKNKSPQKVERKTCKASIQKRWMWTCKIFPKYCEEYMPKESKFKSTSFESLANVHVLWIVALFQKAF